MGLGARLLSRLAAGLLRVGLGGSLGEGTGLALAGASGFFELLAERIDLRLQMGEAALQRLAAGTDNGLHTVIVANGFAVQQWQWRRTRYSNTV